MMQFVATPQPKKRQITCLHSFAKEDEKTNISSTQSENGEFTLARAPDFTFYYNEKRPYSDLLSSHCLEFTTKVNDYCNKPSFLTMMQTLKTYNVFGTGSSVEQFTGPALFAYFNLYFDLAQCKNEYKYGNVIRIPLTSGIFPLTSLGFTQLQYSMSLDKNLFQYIDKTIKIKNAKCIYEELRPYVCYINGLPEIILDYCDDRKDDETKNNLNACPFKQSAKSVFLDEESRTKLLTSEKWQTLFVSKHVSFHKTLTHEILTPLSETKPAKIYIPITTNERAHQIWFYVLGKRIRIRDGPDGFHMFDILDSVVERSALRLNGMLRFEYTSQQSMFTDKILYKYPIPSAGAAGIHTMSFAKKCDPENGFQLKNHLNTCLSTNRIDYVELEIEFSKGANDLFLLYDDITLHYGMFCTSVLTFAGGFMQTETE